MTSSGAILYFLSQLEILRIVCPIAKIQFNNMGYIITFKLAQVDCNILKTNLDTQHFICAIVRKQYVCKLYIY